MAQLKVLGHHPECFFERRGGPVGMAAICMEASDGIPERS